MSFLNNIFVLGVEIIFLRFSILLNYRLRRMGIKKSELKSLFLVSSYDSVEKSSYGE